MVAIIVKEINSETIMSEDKIKHLKLLFHRSSGISPHPTPPLLSP